MSNHEGSAGNVLMAFAIGAIAGAAVALLYAPASGEETRKRLAQRARDGKERAAGMARESREFIGRQRENITAAVDAGREAFKDARKETV
jgi:gas vesicle protein